MGPGPDPRRSAPDVRFRIDEETLDDGTRVLAVSGELDMATAPRLGQRIRRPLFWDGVENVVVDLTDLVLLDSSGATALILSHSHANALGRRLAFVCPEGSNVLRRLHVYGLDARLAMFTTREAALAGLTA